MSNFPPSIDRLVRHPRLIGLGAAALIGISAAAVAIAEPDQRASTAQPAATATKLPLHTDTPPTSPQQSEVPPALTAPNVQQRQEFTPQPTWEQDFAAMPAGSPDAAVWHYDLNPEVPGYNREKQAYTNSPKNVRIEPGTGLILQAHKEPHQYPGDPQQRSFEYTSAKVDTRQSFSFEYGRAEAVMKLPKGAGTWPAFWMLSANQRHTSTYNPTDADWAKDRFYLHDGELDAMEHYGNRPGYVEATVHTYVTQMEGEKKVADYDKAYHAYGVEVTPSKVTWTIDGKPYYAFAKTSDNPDEWPFGNGNKLYMILNLAMGGEGGGAIDDTQQDSWRLAVQAVRFYDYTGPR